MPKALSFRCGFGDLGLQLSEVAPHAGSVFGAWRTGAPQHPRESGAGSLEVGGWALVLLTTCPHPLLSLPPSPAHSPHLAQTCTAWVSCSRTKSL